MGRLRQDINVPEKGAENVTKNDSYIFWGIFVYCLLLSLVFLLICTKSSPLYPFNDWMDSNAYFTMGKGMMNGQIPYRDLFEQKGPFLFFIHGLAYLISNTTFFGVYIFEVIAFSVFLYYCHKIILLFLDIKYSIISLPLIAAIILNMKSFSNGDSAEEFCIPLVTISFFYLLSYFKNVYPQPIDYKWLLANGFAAGCVLWIKFSLLGFWIGWIFSISILSLLNREFIRLIKSWCFFLGGMILATLPWIVYFAVNKSIADWLQTYLFLNIAHYPAQLSFGARLKSVIFETVMGLGLNPIFSILFIIGMLDFMAGNCFIKDRQNRIGLLVCILFSFIGVYSGGTGYLYYFLIFAPFLILGIVAIMNVLRTKYENAISIKKATAIALIIILWAFPLTLKFNQNTYMLRTDKTELFQYKFANAIKETGGQTILNYGSLDLGLYTVTNITPNVRFFYKPAFDYSRFPLIMDEQNRYIREKQVDYIVMVQPASQDPRSMNVPFLKDNYSLILEYGSRIDLDRYSRGNMYTDVKYFLFQKK